MHKKVDPSLKSEDQRIKAVIIGAGNRSLIYASYALQHPDELQIVGVVEPNLERRQLTSERFGISPENCFASVEELVVHPQLADAAINGTMDQFHLETTLPLLKAGYDVLLEKPIGVSEMEVFELYEAAKSYNRTVMICHVMRYAPFYLEIRKQIESGIIGDIIAIQTEENVSYHHMATSFVRGKWNSIANCDSSMLLAKCCHDLDMISWMKGSIRPKKVSSFGGLFQFREEKAPEGSGTRCLVDCPIEATCTYSAKKMYMEQELWGNYAWDNMHLGIIPTHEEKIESLRTSNPYGRCVWRCDNDVVDHQTVIIEFEDGSTASHNLTGATSKPCRTIHITGTKGEISGTMEDGYFLVRQPDTRSGHVYKEERIELNVAADMHGGGDLRLVADFVRTLRGEKPSLSSTALEKSIYGHQIGFAAERARSENSVEEIRSLV
ncbi:Gfo/Idh/MocA family protein [Paenibacillus alginolyticus]|uniref:Gfo/Idh/MocA family oxidoreductase n=2 Tax=Paenibacillus alginolyticus TaxID=59839 RepID=A0ABT4GBP0_9BACL|nr:Gfo/Idh/MocA family oxidoreductase [Paenibacillus alginolyticus]MCY9693567.1 Gfo/Idh/MocA family oxidoreductase [Paenibacillus alginolyticus]MEC0146682.1 Gfo/Idh/MocA family oxidoreductase [Paenibacillus alginolyticus]